MRYVGIDPSTKTGVVILDKNGEVIAAEEVEVKKKKDPERMHSLISKVYSYLREGDQVCIEDFAYSQSNKMALLGGIGWGIRLKMLEGKIDYAEVSTGQLKNFVGEKGNCSKESLIIPLYRLYEFEHKSDNVRDAYILAQIARSLQENIELYEYQEKVLKKVNERMTG